MKSEPGADIHVPCPSVQKPLHLPLPSASKTNPTQPNPTHLNPTRSTKMSSPPSTPTPTPTSTKPTFTDKELRVLQHAWSCLKSAPEIDLEKLRVAAGFNTAKTASNTWGVIKKKIAAVGGGEGKFGLVAGEGGDGS